MDSTTAVAYINKRGGTKSNQLTQLALKIWELCQSHKIMLVAQYLPGIENVEADAESRQMNASIEWTLAKHRFLKIQTGYYTPEVDLFASRLNHQVPLYLACHPDPGAMAIDAFTLDWSQWTSFIHPPIVLLHRILLKIRQDKATALLIAPAWAGQPWYLSLLEMLVDLPAKLPTSQKTIFVPFDQTAVHPLWKTLALTVWHLSGYECKQEDFQRRCATFSRHLGEQVPRKDMQAHRKLGSVGVLKGKNVPFQQL